MFAQVCVIPLGRHPQALADTPLGRHPLGKYPRADTPETATAADGTHPTGMHSSVVWKFAEQVNV